ncbi:MAG: mevalonate kinase [Candidatus Pacebacteria bacterium]|nr:mevalonate kinase [Candidatus Paceibacterota bacterium]
MQKITTSAPGKLMLCGGYAVVHGRPCVVTAVDQRLYVTVEKNGNDQFHLEAPDLGLSTYSKTLTDLGKRDLPKAVRFIETLYKIFLDDHPQNKGIRVSTKSDFSSSFGFGSSSAVTVAFAKALTELYQVKLNEKELFDLCYRAVIAVQGVGSGFDLAAAIWGGTIYYISPAKVVERIEVDKLPIVVGYTGVKADTPTLVRMINNKLESDTARIETIFDSIGDISRDVVKSLNDKNWEQLGSLFNQHQALMRQLGVSSPELEKLITASSTAGAHGAGLSGAGGGDCMLSVVEDESKNSVIKSLNQVGEVLDVKLNAPGVRIES